MVYSWPCPRKKTRAGKYIDLVRIDDRSLKEMLEALVLDAYRKKTGEISRLLFVIQT